MKDKEYVIFDLDGTLVDSFSTVTKACMRVFRAYSKNGMPDNQFFESYCNKNMETMFAEIADRADMTPENFRIAYDKAYASDYLSGTKVIKKQYERLQAAKGNGLGVIVLTNKHQHIAENVCQKLFNKGEIDIIIGRYGATPIKPHMKLLERFNAHEIEPRTHCLLYYGDSDVDCECAKMLGVPYVKV